MAIGKLFHLIHMTGDLTALEAWYHDVFGVRDFIEHNYMAGEKRDASLVILGDAVIEPLAPAFSVEGWDAMPLGRFYQRFGTHWHSIAWYTDDAGEIWRRCTDNGIRVYVEGGVPAHTQPPASAAITTHPRDTISQLEFFRLDERLAERDPRLRADWDPDWWVTNHPLGLQRLAYTTVLTRDLDHATRLTPGPRRHAAPRGQLRAHPGTASSYILMGEETIVDRPPDARRHDRRPRPRVQRRDPPLRHVQGGRPRATEEYLTAKGIKVLDRDDRTLITDPATTHGVPFRWTTWVVPGDPRA